MINPEDYIKKIWYGCVPDLESQRPAQEKAAHKPAVLFLMGTDLIGLLTIGRYKLLH